jgi:hypothetical protein
LADFLYMYQCSFIFWISFSTNFNKRSTWFNWSIWNRYIRFYFLHIFFNFSQLISPIPIFPLYSSIYRYRWTSDIYFNVPVCFLYRLAGNNVICLLLQNLWNCKKNMFVPTFKYFLWNNILCKSKKIFNHNC